MNASSQHHLDTDRGTAWDDLLSSDPGKRIIELQLIERMLAPTPLVSAFNLDRAAMAATKDCAASNFERMTDPSKDEMLATLENAVPGTEDFGPFRGRRVD
ncbi:hypothetical protein [Roseateles sp.]|uniref:hypothetical protein n=1 Tax=Roseateles sp. TaxID=1971397 RepID=UPI003BA7EB00